MNGTPKTVVTFKSSAFNTSEQKPYFLNPGCFGDDLAMWFAEQLRERGCEVPDTPGQEDFGWYVRFLLSGLEHCLVIGYRPSGSEGCWIAWLERQRGRASSLIGNRKRDIKPAAAQIVHDVLSSAQHIRDIRWHSPKDLDDGNEEGTCLPS